MPLVIQKSEGHIKKIIRNNKEFWVYIFPIKTTSYTEGVAIKNTALGYAGVSFPLDEMLVSLSVFKFINSVQSVIEHNATFKLDEMISVLEYKLKDNLYREELESTTKTALLRIIMFIVVSMLIALIALHRFFIKPLKNISSEIKALYVGDNVREYSDATLSPQPIYELENVRRSFNNYQSRFAALNIDLDKNNKEFYRLAHEDVLTGTYNRRAFEDDWNENNAQNNDDLYAVLIFDCDNFKPINDSYGHAVGDEVIKSIARVLSISVRDTDKLYRLGGDEFATILKNTRKEDAVAVAEICRANILAYDFRIFGLSESVSVSIGISVSHVAEKSFTNVMKQADLAMYKAKRPNESSVICYSDDLLSVESLSSAEAVNAVFAAIKYPNKIKMRYQPIVKLPSLENDYVEALVKIEHKNKTYMPNKIFPVVESRKLDMELDLAVITVIENDLNSDLFPEEQGVSLNLSALSIINTKVIDRLIELKKSFKNKKIIIEITETALITQIDKATNNINQLRDAGYLVAIDDFGNGYSSLRYLTSMPVDIVKFDISMIRLLESDNIEHRNMIEKLAGLVMDLDYIVVAEGIETQSLLDKVIALGFTYSQGYFTGRPRLCENSKYFI